MKQLTLGLLLALFAWACDAPEGNDNTPNQPVTDTLIPPSSGTSEYSSESSSDNDAQARGLIEDVSGTYIMGDQEGTEGGGYLAIQQLDDNQLKFELDLNNGAPNYHSGTAYGTITRDGNVAVYTTSEYAMGGESCAISFVFEPDQVGVEQKQGSDMACGFGQGVIANGTFKKTSEEAIFRHEEGL